MEGPVHRRSRAARLAVATLGLSIVTSMLAVIPALAADTRNIHIGSPNSAGVIPVDGDGILTTTPVSAGEAFVVSVRVHNDGPQNINNVLLHIGSDGEPAVEAQGSATITPVTPTNLTGGATVASILAGGDKCKADEAPDDGRIVCDVGTLGKRKGFIATLLINAPNTGDLHLKATVKVSENANDNGANTDTFAAEGSVAVAARTCEGLFGYLPAGQAKNLTTVGLTGDCDERITIDLKGETTNQNAVIFAEYEPADDGSDFCGTGTTCFGNAFEIGVNDGEKVDGYIEVTLFWADLPDGFNINKAGVFHDGETKDVLIEATKKFECSAKKLTDCWTESVVSGDTWRFTFRIPENGFIRGKG